LRGFADERVLVTGVSGFIGSHLARRLVNEGAKVYGFVRSGTGSDTWRIKDILNKIDIFCIDIRNYELVLPAIRKIEPVKIFHLAANINVSRSLHLLPEMVDTNITGTLNLLQALDRIEYDCFVNTGTSEEYGNNPTPFREDHPMMPVSPYSASKASTTLFCQMLHKTIGLPITTLRPFLTYGPMQEANMLVPSVIKSTIEGRIIEMTKGEQTREFNYVDDVVDGFIRASISPRAMGEIINIGNGIEYRIVDVVQLILNLMESTLKPKIGALPYRPGEAWHFFCDNSKARDILAWEPKVDLEEGLKKTIAWYQSQQIK
jgi:UDP-glucose 4-epimerase